MPSIINKNAFKWMMKINEIKKSNWAIIEYKCTHGVSLNCIVFILYYIFPLTTVKKILFLFMLHVSTFIILWLLIFIYHIGEEKEKKILTAFQYNCFSKIDLTCHSKFYCKLLSPLKLLDYFALFCVLNSVRFHFMMKLKQKKNGYFFYFDLGTSVLLKIFF